MPQPAFARQRGAHRYGSFWYSFAELVSWSSRFTSFNPARHHQAYRTHIERGKNLEDSPRMPPGDTRVERASVTTRGLEPFEVEARSSGVHNVTSRTSPNVLKIKIRGRRNKFLVVSKRLFFFLRASSSVGFVYVCWWDDNAVRSCSRQRWCALKDSNSNSFYFTPTERGTGRKSCVVQLDKLPAPLHFRRSTGVQPKNDWLVYTVTWKTNKNCTIPKNK